VVVGSALVVVGPVVVVGSVLVVVGPVVVGPVVVGPVVVGPVVVVGAVTGGWVVVASKAENASEVVVPAVAGAWAGAGPAVVVGRLPARGPVGGSTRTSVPARPGRSAAPGRVPGVVVTVGGAGWPRPPERPGHRW